MKWVTRSKPKIDRLACPWLIRKFVDPGAEIMFVPFSEVMLVAEQQEAVPFDIPGVEYTHYGKDCTFDYIIHKHNITDEAVKRMAPIVRGADTDRHDLAPEAAGLWAISAGLADNITDDHHLLEAGMLLYDALYSWASRLYGQKHLQSSPFERMLIEVYHKLSENEKPGKKTPAWVKDLKALIQDQIDADMVVGLREISGELNLNPSYLSREFSRHFDNLTFGEYMRKIRIEKAVRLMENSDYSLTEIAYLTGFSDQSHFNRIFKKHTGKTPSVMRKELKK